MLSCSKGAQKNVIDQEQETLAKEAYHDSYLDLWIPANTLEGSIQSLIDLGVGKSITRIFHQENEDGEAGYIFLIFQNDDDFPDEGGKKIVCESTSGITFAKCCRDYLEANTEGCLEVRKNGKTYQASPCGGKIVDAAITDFGTSIQ